MPTCINAFPESNLVLAAMVTVTKQGRNNWLKLREEHSIIPQQWMLFI